MLPKWISEFVSEIETDVRWALPPADAKPICAKLHQLQAALRDLPPANVGLLVQPLGVDGTPQTFACLGEYSAGEHTILKIWKLRATGEATEIAFADVPEVLIRVLDRRGWCLPPSPAEMPNA